MGRTQFAQVDLGNIEQGQFLGKCNEAFCELQRNFVAHVAKHGVSASAELKIKVAVKYDGLKKSYAIVTDIEEKLPKKPATVTNAFEQEGELWAPNPGSSKGNPRQMNLLPTESETK